jgi:hypothetical protein
VSDERYENKNGISKLEEYEISLDYIHCAFTERKEQDLQRIKQFEAELEK